MSSGRRFRIATLAPLVLGFVAAALFAQPGKPKKVALVVGVNKYAHAALNKPNPLEFAEADVADLAKELKAGGYDEVVVLTGSDATRENILKKLDALRKLPGDGGVLMVALAGHGLQPGDATDAYFCPFDADQRVVPAGDPNSGDPWDYKTMLPLSDVLAYLKASSASTRVLMVDACRNDPASGRGRGVGTGLKVGDLPDNTAVLLSCSRGQRAFEHKDFGTGHGAFFHHVLLGLREKGRDKKGRVTADSLWEYVRDAVPESVAGAVKGAEQRPFRLITGDVDLQLAQAEPKAGEERSVEIADGVKMVFCYIPAGEAQLGSPKAERDALLKAINAEKESEWLSLEAEDKRGKFKTKGFWLGKYEVTQGEWEKVMGKNPSYFDGKKENKVKGLETSRFPVESVSWDECQKFVAEVTDWALGGNELIKVKLNGKFCLPHEDEWEYAYRGGKGNKQPFYWGSALNGTEANCDGNKPFGPDAKGADLERTCSVEWDNGGKYEKHPWGLRHMAGNVWEWCENKYEGSDNRIVRGGAWGDDSGYCRGANRSSPVHVSSDGLYGFRLCFRPD